MAIVDSGIYEIDDLDKVEYKIDLNDLNGVEETSITIYFSDGSFRVFTFSREI